jgi:hypothetical protein
MTTEKENHGIPKKATKIVLDESLPNSQKYRNLGTKPAEEKPKQQTIEAF